jgi:hypothetical protein
MFDVAASLQEGFDRADVRMRDAQNSVASENAGRNSRSADAAMAQVAQTALFREALLDATRARLLEIKMVTK